MKVLLLLLLSPLQGRLSSAVSCPGPVGQVWAAGHNWQPQNIGWEAPRGVCSCGFHRGETSHALTCLWWGVQGRMGLFQSKEMVSIHPFWKWRAPLSVSADAGGDTWERVAP